MKLKDIKGIFDNIGYYLSTNEINGNYINKKEVGEKELEVDMKKVYRIMKQFSDYYGIADENVRKIAQAIARNFPVKVKK